MSLRSFAVRLMRHGRFFYQKHIFSSVPSAKISEESVPATKLLFERSSRVAESVPRHFTIRNVGLAVGHQARRLFIENVLCKFNHGFNAHIKKQVTKRLFFGDAAPLFTFVGVSLASGSGFLSRQDELEGFCWEIRNAVSQFQWSLVVDEGDKLVFSQEEIKLDDLSIGNMIAKGCSAAVYAAKIKDESELLSKQPTSSNTSNHDEESTVENGSSITEYPFALKMMFNYNVQSSSLAILQAMYQETIPARRFYSNEFCFWEKSLNENKTKIPPHPNIVAMYNVFADNTPQLPGSAENYPNALPSAFHPDGYGRNMTLFLLMKRYKYSLAQFLEKHSLKQRDSVLLFAQLLEGVAHMNLHGVAHRDLKSDNILVDQVITNDDNSVPVLVITDFGCCLADRTYGLEIPFKTDLVNKGGNMSLMAPEIILKTPGTFSVLNFSKSDLWAAGTIAYEIFGLKNPFLSVTLVDEKPEVLRNIYYKESDLPSLKENAPTIIRKLIENILQRNPNMRLSVAVASNVCHLYLWAPSAWITSQSMPSNQEILQWLLCLTTKVLCEGRLCHQPSQEKDNQSVPSSSNATSYITKKSARRSHPDYILISSFLCRANFSQIKEAVSWIQDNNS